jgi:hypothetical protein
MKKIILAATLLAVGASQMQTARAGGWPIAAGVFGGLVAGTVIADSIARPPVYYAPSPAYYPPANYYAPAPVTAYPAAPAVVYAAPAPRVVVAAPYYPPAPVVTFGFGFGRTYWGGDYYRYHGRVYQGRR